MSLLLRASYPPLTPPSTFARTNKPGIVTPVYGDTRWTISCRVHPWPGAARRGFSPVRGVPV